MADSGQAASFHIALLRGVNVGGKNRLPMKELAAIFREAGAGDVQTYIQSGNVVFRAAPPLAERLPSMVTAAISSRFGFEVPVVTRTVAEFRRVARENPFVRAGVDYGKLHVVFLADSPGTAKADALDRRISAPDELAVQGREVYLRCPNGLGRSKLTTAYFDSKLATTSTIRNWRTVLKLVDLLPGNG